MSEMIKSRIWSYLEVKGLSHESRRSSKFWTEMSTVSKDIPEQECCRCSKRVLEVMDKVRRRKKRVAFFSMFIKLSASKWYCWL